MALRIDLDVVHGEIDCRIRGRVTGRILLAGGREPLELQLAGNPWRDLAGRVLRFVNPTPRLTAGPRPAAAQNGVVGDMTASRKVKVPDIPLEQIGEYFAARKPFPWHWSNALYLEWFSRRDGRVVLESVDFQLTIDANATWEMTAEEEAAQRRENNETMGRFVTDPGSAGEPGRKPAADDDPLPRGDDEADRMLAESERLMERISERLDSEGLGEADFERILKEELERRRGEHGDPPLSSEEEKPRGDWIEPMNRAASEAAEELAREVELHAVHPLSAWARQLSLRLKEDARMRGWVMGETPPGHPVALLLNTAMIASAKLANALDGRFFPPAAQECSSALARLERAHRLLEDALMAVGGCADEKIVDAAWLAAARKDLLGIVAGVEPIMAELRERLARGIE